MEESGPSLSSTGVGSSGKDQGSEGGSGQRNQDLIGCQNAPSPRLACRKPGFQADWEVGIYTFWTNTSAVKTTQDLAQNTSRFLYSASGQVRRQDLGNQPLLLIQLVLSNWRLACKGPWPQGAHQGAAKPGSPKCHQHVASQEV